MLPKPHDAGLRSAEGRHFAGERVELENVCVPCCVPFRFFCQEAYFRKRLKYLFLLATRLDCLRRR